MHTDSSDFGAISAAHSEYSKGSNIPSLTKPSNEFTTFS